MLISAIVNPKMLNSGMIKLELATVFILETSNESDRLYGIKYSSYTGAGFRSRG